MNNDRKLKHLTLIFPAFVILLVVISLIISYSSTNRQEYMTWSAERTAIAAKSALISDSTYLILDSTGKHIKVFTNNISYHQSEDE
jgi:p-aminobenzoyl-glutamate transporter AbgT